MRNEKSSERWEDRVVEEIISRMDNLFAKAVNHARHTEDRQMIELLTQLRSDFNHISLGFDKELHATPSYEPPGPDYSDIDAIFEEGMEKQERFERFATKEVEGGDVVSDHRKVTFDADGKTYRGTFRVEPVEGDSDE